MKNIHSNCQQQTGILCCECACFCKKVFRSIWLKKYFCKHFLKWICEMFEIFVAITSLHFVYLYDT